MQIKRYIKRIFFLLAIINIIAVFDIFAQKETILTGRTIDTKGNPVSADLQIPCGDLCLNAKSQKDGFFAVSYPNVCEGALWITSRIDWENLDYPFVPGFSLPSDYYKKYKSVKFLEDGKYENFDLGDIPIQVYYGKIKVIVDQKNTAKVFNFENDVKVKIRDRKGNLIGTSSSNKGINKQESSYNIALPYGTYQLEIKKMINVESMINEGPAIAMIL